MEIIKLKSNKRVERVRFNGIIYRRYPQAKGFSDRNYFRCSIGDKQRGFGALHRDIWKFHRGEIPEGFHIHHKDENPLNNDISNLEALEPKEHRKRHVPTPEQRRAISYIKTLEYRLEKAKKGAAKWHSSPEGRKWHSEHAKKSFKRRKRIKKRCEQCNKNYFTKSVSSRDRFCSGKCKAAWRRAQGLDNENRICKSCEKSFSVNKYDKSQCCSLSCGAKYRWVVRKRKKREICVSF